MTKAQERLLECKCAKCKVDAKYNVRCLGCAHMSNETYDNRIESQNLYVEKLRRNIFK